MHFYLAMVGFEPTPTATAAPSNTETTVIPSRPLRSFIYISGQRYIQGTNIDRFCKCRVARRES